MAEELFERYRVNPAQEAFEGVVRAYQPLVASVCRRYLRRAEDVEDAVQETFLKLSQNAAAVGDSVAGWLAATAHTTCIDLIRRSLRERRRLEAKWQMANIATPDVQRQWVRGTLERMLGEALLRLGEADRLLIVERFFQKTPLRVIAARNRVSVPTISRRAGAALTALAEVLGEMGIPSLNDRALAEYFRDGAVAPETGALEEGSEALRFAPDWGAALRTHPGGIVDAGPRSAGPFAPGWNRPIRVGAYISYHSTLVIPPWFPQPMRIDLPVDSTALVHSPAIQWVAIVEPDTSELGPVERTMRGYELTGGLISSRDSEGLKSLDVILMGLNHVYDRAGIAALHDAVSSGVGLLKEWWLGGAMEERHEDPKERALILAESPICHYHCPSGCETDLPATVVEEHRLFPSFKLGDQATVRGCGPVYKVAKGATVIMTKDRVIGAKEHGIAGLGETRMPVVVVGELGKGQVIVMNCLRPPTLMEQMGVRGDYLTGLFGWLAGEKQRRVR
jgi:RNA polymerase sigma factor (sigma-70 family)